MATASIVPPQETAPLSEVQRIINVFFSPSKTFSDLRRNASWWGPFLLVVIVSVLFVSVVDQKVGFRKTVENQLRTQPKQADQLEKMSPADTREEHAGADHWYQILLLRLPTHPADYLGNSWQGFCTRH